MARLTGMPVPRRQNKRAVPRHRTRDTIDDRNDRAPPGNRQRAAGAEIVLDIAEEQGVEPRVVHPPSLASSEAAGSSAETQCYTPEVVPSFEATSVPGLSRLWRASVCAVWLIVASAAVSSRPADTLQSSSGLPPHIAGLFEEPVAFQRM